MTYNVFSGTLNATQSQSQSPGWRDFAHAQRAAWSLTQDHTLFCQRTPFYSARNARIASAVLATAIPSVCLSVRLSVCHTPVLCQNDRGTWHDAVFTVG